MTCPDCKGTGKIALLTSQVDCNCELAVPADGVPDIDLDDYDITITMPDDLGDDDLLMVPTYLIESKVLFTEEEMEGMREIFTPAAVEQWLKRGSLPFFGTVKEIKVDPVSINLPVDPNIHCEVSLADLEMDAFATRAEESKSGVTDEELQEMRKIIEKGFTLEDFKQWGEAFLDEGEVAD